MDWLRWCERRQTVLLVWAVGIAFIDQALLVSVSCGVSSIDISQQAIAAPAAMSLLRLDDEVAQIGSQASRNFVDILRLGRRAQAGPTWSIADLSLLSNFNL